MQEEHGRLELTGNGRNGGAVNGEIVAKEITNSRSATHNWG